MKYHGNIRVRRLEVRRKLFYMKELLKYKRYRCFLFLFAIKMRLRKETHGGKKYEKCKKKNLWFKKIGDN